jgi:zinc protease
LLESKVFTTHNYRAGLLDDKGHTKAPGLEVPAVREFYNRYYQPEHTAVVVVGDFEPAVAFAMVERAFGHLPRGPKRPPLAAEPAIEQVREVLIPSPLSRQRSTLAWVVPELGHPDRPALDALARLLSRRTAAGGTPIEAEMGGRVDRELFLLSATGDKAAAALQEVLADVHAETCAADEVEAVKRLLAETYSTLPLRARPYFSLAGTMGVYAVLGHPDHPADYAARIEELTPARLREVARRQLPAERYVAVTFGRSVEAAVALPHDPHALQKAAAAAVEAGELDRAILAYTRLLAMGPNKMFKVIYLSSRGQVKVKQKDYDGAIADYVAALSVVDYPAVRTLLKEARELKAGAGNAGEGNAGAGKTAKPASRPTPGDKR